MITGSCLCGGATWQCEALAVAHDCHCSRCRKTHGAPFVSWAFAEGFAWRDGEDRIARHESAPGFFRAFCSTCGSSLPAVDPEGRTIVPLGVVDGDPGTPNQLHVHAASVPPWRAITDDAPRFDELPPGMEGPQIPAAAIDPETAEGARGSCLCGAVRWRLTAVPTLARYCHCSRCRKARAAACTANCFLPVAALRFTAGEDRSRDYPVPGARFFHHTFCTTCGGGTPRVDRARGIAVVPLGSMDDDPGTRPTEHIFVGSKAPWYEITDDLPQHDGRPPGL